MIELRDHVGLVKDFARRIAPPALLDDCIQAGMVGLWKAAQRFDETRSVRFSTFAGHYIRGAVLDEIRRQQFGSRHHHRDLPMSLDAMPRDVLEIADPADPFGAVDFLLEVQGWLLVLPIKHWFVVQESLLRDRTATAIGHDLGVSQSRVSQIRTEALAMLRTVVAA